MASSAPQLSPQTLDHNLGDWFGLSAAHCDDILFGNETIVETEHFTGPESWPLDSSFSDGSEYVLDEQAEKQTILEEMQAAGLHRPGTFRRQAFSMSDLTALQPPLETQNAVGGGRWSPNAYESHTNLWSQPDTSQCLNYSLPPSTAQMFGSGASEQVERRFDAACMSLDSLSYHSATLELPSPTTSGLGCIPENDLLQSGTTAAAALDRIPTGATVPMVNSSASPTLLRGPRPEAGLPAHPHMAQQLHVRPGKMRRSHSALELSSMAMSPSTGGSQQHHTARRQVGVELTTPEGHTYRAGRLAPEERLQKILKYRQKRHERNFTKRIKYQCRKTLADSRPRVRGRFARNDDVAAVMPSEQKGRRQLLEAAVA